MKIKSLLIKFPHSSYRHANRFIAVLLAFVVINTTGCGRKSQVQEDEANLKLVGYNLDQIGFFKAVRNDDIQALEIFKEQKFDLDQQDLNGRSAAYVAAEAGSVRALNFLSKNGADLEAADMDGVTPLMAAARVGKSESAEAITYLLEKGADARRKDNIGKFALIHAMDAKSTEAIHLLAAESREMLDTGILYAADMDEYETIPVLVKYGASVYARNNGKTSLMIAAERGNDRAAKALLAEGANLYALSDDGKLAKDYAVGNDRVLAVLIDSETDAQTDPLALEWSEEELEELVQKAMDRAPVPEVAVGGAELGGEPKEKLTLNRIKGKNLPVEFGDSKTMAEQVTMTAYAEKSLPIKVRADDTGRVEIYDLRERKVAQEPTPADPAGQVEQVNPVVQEGSQIGMTGLRVKQIKKKIVNNKLTGGQDKELVTLMIEDEKTGQLRELYAGYESQIAEAVAVLKINDTGELLIVERNDEFYDLKGTAYKVIDVNDEEVIIENIASNKQTMLPLMGVKR